MDAIKVIRAVAISGCLLALAGCATAPTVVENDFGNSVRQMTQAQVANPAAPVDNNPIDQSDGPRINAAVEAYRKGVSDPNDTKKPITVGVDN